MKCDQEIHHRKSIRLQGYDYSQEGAYYITICTHDREFLFGEIVNGKMVLNKFGLIAQNEWKRTEEMRKYIILDEFVIMPNHMHGIIIINTSIGEHPTHVGAYCNTPLPPKFQSPSNNLGSIIRGYKSSVTTQININRKTPSHPVWQRNYYEHIIRNENDLNRILNYIINNPKNWEMDDLYQGK